MALSRYEHKGSAPATGLASGIGAGDVSFTVLSGSGYPTGAVGKFVICIDAGTSSEEKILCSARSGTGFTVAASGRGFDDTTATAHSAGAVNVIHVLAAAEIDDTSDHVYTTGRDDHTQYLRADATRAGTGSQTLTALAVTNNATVGGTLGVTGAASLSSTLGVTGAATLSSTLGVTGAVTGSSTVSGTALAASLAGTGRYVGSTAGAPVSGTFLTGDFADDPTNRCFWVCVSGGSPGTWGQVGHTTHFASVYRNGAFTSDTFPSTTPFVFDTVLSDPGSMYSVSTGRFTAPIAGVWSVKAKIAFTPTSSVYTVNLTVYKNSTAMNTSIDIGGTSTTLGWLAAPIDVDVILAANDTLYVSSSVVPISGGLTGGIGTFKTYCMVRYVGPAL